MGKIPPLSKLAQNPLAAQAQPIAQAPQAVDRRGHGNRAVAGRGRGQQRLSLPRRILGAALTRLATRSVPGAIVVGGAILAKHLYDKKKAREAQEQADSSTQRRFPPRYAKKDG
jgi:hypothetical protein